MHEIEKNTVNTFTEVLAKMCITAQSDMASESYDTARWLKSIRTVDEFYAKLLDLIEEPRYERYSHLKFLSSDLRDIQQYIESEKRGSPNSEIRPTAVTLLSFYNQLLFAVGTLLAFYEQCKEEQEKNELLGYTKQILDKVKHEPKG